MNVIRDYKEWNDALWRYFFPVGDESPILYIDDNIIQQIGTNAKIESDNITDDFLHKTLLSECCIKEFATDWHTWNGYSYCSAKQWDDISLFLCGRFLGDTPAYFALLCAIMYVACTTEPKHKPMKAFARKYLGDNYAGKFGELIDSLFLQLRKDVPSFFETITITQKNSSRLRYHSGLRPSDREDFIDFLEINKLKWEYELYHEFINDRLIPALNYAGKRNIVDFVKDPVFIPYVKSLLQRDLDFTKTKSSYNNTVQPINVQWRYELYFDFNGAKLFITPLSYLPFAIELSNGHFTLDESNSNTDCIAVEQPFIKIKETELEFNGIKYCLNNIASNSWNDIIYFERVSDEAYYQVEEPVAARSYVMFVNNRSRKFKEYSDGYKSSNVPFSIDGYSQFYIDNFKYSNKRRSSNRARIVDEYELQGIGTWFSIRLGESQNLYWEPDRIGCRLAKIEYTKRKNGKCFFRLERTGDEWLGGKLYVSSDGCKTFDNSEKITDVFLWDGKSRKYYLNGWGEVSTAPQEINVEPRPRLKRLVTQCCETQSPNSDMLLQILYDVADEDGCVSQSKMVAAVNFVLDYHGFAPEREKRNNVIVALRRLGYIEAYYNCNTNLYENQLCPAYLELTDHSLDMVRSAYIVKGVYSHSRLQELCDTKAFIRYKRPYSTQSGYGSELLCIPDMVIYQTNTTPIDGWRVITYPIAEAMINVMESMNAFCSKYRILDSGEMLHTPFQYTPPCMIRDKRNNEVLLTKKNGCYYTHSTYINDQNFVVPVPVQLSRLYCQNMNNLPVCIMGKDVNRNVNYASITFLSDMGLPEILDIALCDQNLGLPKSKFVFVADSDSSMLHKKCLEYSLSATNDNHQIIQSAIEKMSNRKIDDFGSSTAIQLTESRYHKRYSMKLLHDNEQRYYLGLIYNNEVIAFSTGSKSIYYKTHGLNSYTKVKCDSAFSVFSDIINGNCPNVFGDPYSKEFPDFNSEEANYVSIINNKKYEYKY